MRLDLACCVCAVAVLAARPAAAHHDRGALTTEPETSPGGETDAPSDERKPIDEVAPTFGQARELVWSGSAIGSIKRVTYTGSDASYFDVTFGPGVDYFIARRVSLGVSVGFRYGDDRGYGADSSLVSTKSFRIGGGPRIGYAFSVGDSVSFWPRLTLGVVYAHSESTLISGSSLSVPGSPVGSAATTHAGPWLRLELPILVHVSPRFFIGLDPSLTHDFSHAVASNAATSASAEATTVELAVLVGGYVGGRDAPPTKGADQVDSTLPRRRFGDAGTVAFSNELELGGFYTTYAGTGSLNAQLGVVVGTDYFVWERASVGGALYASYNTASGLQPDGSVVDYHATALGLEVRFGIDIQLGKSLSWWPRLGLSFGSKQSSETSAGAVNEHHIATTTFKMIAPLLLHVAQHFFIGAGPTLAIDLSGTTASGNDLRATSYGASGLLGGWL